MSDTGRYFVKDLKTGRVFCVEPISNKGNKVGGIWGDVDPVTKKTTGDYGKKHKGSVSEEDSIITEENGFKDIVLLDYSKNPNDYIDKLLYGDGPRMLYP